MKDTKSVRIAKQFLSFEIFNSMTLWCYHRVVQILIIQPTGRKTYLRSMSSNHKMWSFTKVNGTDVKNLVKYKKKKIVLRPWEWFSTLDGTGRWIENESNSLEYFLSFEFTNKWARPKPQQWIIPRPLVSKWAPSVELHEFDYRYFRTDFNAE